MRYPDELITSKQNALVVETAKLADRKHRRASGLFRFDGVKLAEEALRSGAPLTSVLLHEERAQALLSRLEQSGLSIPDGVRTVCLSGAVFDRLSEENAPEGIICVSKTLPLHQAGDLTTVSAQERIVLLESVRDPSNLGAIVRSAAAFGVDHLIISEDCADIYNAKTVRASMGTLFSQRISRVARIPDAIAALRGAGRRTFAAALDRDAWQLGAFPVMTGDCVVIGNEGHGLSAQTIAACDHSVFIPMTARAESLNAAVAASVLMWAFGAPSEN